MISYDSGGKTVKILLMSLILILSVIIICAVVAQEEKTREWGQPLAVVQAPIAGGRTRWKRCCSFKKLPWFVEACSGSLPGAGILYEHILRMKRLVCSRTYRWVKKKRGYYGRTEKTDVQVPLLLWKVYTGGITLNILALCSQMKSMKTSTFSPKMPTQVNGDTVK